MKKTFAELREQRMTANEKLGDIYAKAANRELNAEEQVQVINLTREIEQCETQMRGISLENANIQAMANHRRESLSNHFRELLRENRDGKSQRTILLKAGKEIDGATNNTIGNITASGAIELTIHDLIPTLNEGLGLAKGVNIVTGVTGNEVWPVGINDVEMEEVGEIDALNEQNLDFANITPTPKRCGLKVYISNQAIDNAAFDLLGYVQQKFTLAQRKYLAKKLYSQAAWTGVKGPFSNLTPKGTITLGSGNDYKAILQAVAEFTNKGFDADKVCLIVDAVTEANLKATPKAVGQGGFIIENGKLAGYDYVVTHFINTELSGTQLVETSDRYIGIGYFEWEAIQQHGDVRFVIDPLTLADRNITRVILNTAWSMTDLSTRINGGEETATGSGVYKTQAFALYKVEEASEEETTSEA
ncbi:MAG: phage major capsid protein [Prevotella sp.]|nr:phage major capsid protein [Prevotella sp.]